jgi:hypothetical protein
MPFEVDSVVASEQPNLNLLKRGYRMEARGMRYESPSFVLLLFFSHVPRGCLNQADKKTLQLVQKHDTDTAMA